jgi:Protein of unknown function (DUF2934)
MATRRSSGSQRPTKATISTPPSEVLSSETTPAPAKRAPRRRTPASANTEQPTAPVRVDVPPEARHAMIAEAAYLRAERRGFTPGYDIEDWLAAESEVDALLSAGPGGAQ